MKLTIGSKVTAGFVFVLAVLLLLSIVSYIRITGLLKAVELVEHTHSAIEHTEHILSVMQDIETGQRGYIITGEERYLEPYYLSINRINKETNDLRTLTANKKSNNSDLTFLKPLSGKNSLSATNRLH